MGQAPPLDDPELTHGICRACGLRLLQAAGITDLPLLLAASDPEEAAHAGDKALLTPI
jgi:hypothetical protein